MVGAEMALAEQRWQVSATVQQLSNFLDLLQGHKPRNKDSNFSTKGL